MTLELCDQILTALGRWSDAHTWSQACVRSVDEVTRLFQNLVLVLPLKQVNRRAWDLKLQRFRTSLEIHYEKRFDPLLVAIEQCITSIRPPRTRLLVPASREGFIDLRVYEVRPDREGLMEFALFRNSGVKFRGLEWCAIDHKDMAIFFDSLGYFPLDLVNYSIEALELVTEIYSKFPHLPIQGISSLFPNIFNLKTHQLCQRLWIIAIKEMEMRGLTIFAPVGGFVPVLEVDLNIQALKEASLHRGFFSLYLGKGCSFETAEIVPLAAINYPAQEVRRQIWEKVEIQFSDKLIKVNALDLRLVRDCHPSLDFATITHETFEWIITSHFKRSEFSIASQLQPALAD